MLYASNVLVGLMERPGGDLVRSSSLIGNTLSSHRKPKVGRLVCLLIGWMDSFDEPLRRMAWLL